MSHFRALAVDDEPLARELLHDLLERDSEIEVIGTCGDGASALETIRAERPDIVFLDIEMPEQGGLEVARALGPDALPVVVFVTAFGEHALRAFDLEALDYVVKPFTDERFFAALERAKRRVRERKMGELAEQMAALTAGVGVGEKAEPGTDEEQDPPEYLSRLAVTVGDRTVVVKTREIAWIESSDYYARLHTKRGAHLIRAALASFEKKLDPRHFLRVHRGAIVNVEAVAEIRHLMKGAREVVLGDGTALRVSRSRLRAVEEVLAPRLGR